MCALFVFVNECMCVITLNRAGDTEWMCVCVCVNVRQRDHWTERAYRIRLMILMETIFLMLNHPLVWMFNSRINDLTLENKQITTKKTAWRWQAIAMANSGRSNDNIHRDTDYWYVFVFVSSVSVVHAAHTHTQLLCAVQLLTTLPLHSIWSTETNIPNVP